MTLYPIFHRHGAAPIAVVEAETYREALEYAIRRGTRLVYADLKGIDVPRAFLARGDFRGADLRGARLKGVSLNKADLQAALLKGAVLERACLWKTDLRHADLREADLRHANLKDARLVGADLRGTLLIGAKLDGAILDWRWSTVALELLRGSRTRPGDAFSGLAELAFHDDARPYSWLKVLLGQESRADWALGVLSRHLRQGDNAPELLRRLASDVAVDAGRARASLGSDGAQLDHSQPIINSDAPATAPVLWIRRHGAVGPTALKAN
jgi:Pentapeptide repeats (8 copies)